MFKKYDTWCHRVFFQPGIYEYKFIVDGVWMHDNSKPTVLNSLGTLNNICTIKPGVKLNPKRLDDFVTFNNGDGDINDHSDVDDKYNKKGLIVSGGGDCSIKIWDLNSGVNLNILSGHIDTIYCLAICRKNKKIISGCKSGYIIIWDILTGSLLKNIRAHRNAVYSIVVSNDNEYIISGGNDQYIKVWSFDGTCIRKYPVGDGIIRIAISQDNKYVAWSTKRGEIALEKFKPDKVELEYDSKRFRYANDACCIYAICFSKNNKIISANSCSYFGDSCAIKVIDPINSNSKCCCYYKLLGYHDHTVHSIKLSANGKKLISASRDSTIKIWDINSGLCLNTLKKHKSWVYDVAIDDYGERIISAGRDNTLRIWDINSGDCLHTLIGHSKGVYCVDVAYV
jgi:WD40 repeat protein